MRGNIFSRLVKNNILWFLLEIISAYIAAKALVLGNNKISDAIDALFNGNLSGCINIEFWIYVVILIALSFIFTYIQVMATRIFAANIQTGFRKEAGQQLLRIQFKYFDSHTSARVLNNFIDDVTRMSEYYSDILPSMVTSIITIATILVSLIQIDYILTIILLFVVPFMIIVSRFTGGMVSKLTRKHAKLHDEINELAYDALSGIQVVKSFGLEEHFKSKIKDTNKKILKFEYRRNAISSIAWITSELLRYSPQVILGIAAFFRVRAGFLSIGDMSVFLLLLNRIVSPLGMLPNYYIEAKIDLVSKHRLEELMGFPDEGQNACIEEQGIQQEQEEDIAVSFKNVSFSYDSSVQVLSDFNLDVRNGQNIAFVGESGGGKSTIFKLICGLYEADSGHISLFGKDMGKCSLDDLRKDIAIVSQDTFLFPYSIAWNIACGDDNPDMDRIQACCIMARIHDDIMAMPSGYETNVGERGDLISGGQKQRIAIARALYKNAKLILFDEPTASVDVDNENQIKLALDNIKNQCTVITIAHRLNTIIDADCIYVLHRGRIVESGTHDELMKLNQVYSSLYSMSVSD